MDGKRFAGRTALITGAAGNIGLATALHLAREGAAVALLDLEGEPLHAARAAVAAIGGRVTALACDVTDGPAVAEAVARAEAAGAIDLLFNNAGYQGEFRPVQDYPAADFERVLRINVLGAFHVLQAVSRPMIARRYGRIVNTASMAGVGGPPNMAAYAASKFAIVGLTQTVAKDLAPHGIRVNAISPAFIGPGVMWERQVALQAAAGSQYYVADPAAVAKQMIDSVPMRRFGDLSEIPAVVAFLLSDDSSYITGVNLPIAGGIL